MNRERDSDSSEKDAFQTSQFRRQQAKKKWDSFRDDPVKVHSQSMQESKLIDNAERFSKILAYIFTFIVVLGCGVISKGTMLFMTSQLSTKIKGYCDPKLGRDFEVTLPIVERVSWIWILIFTYWVPELGTFIRSVRICSFKSYKIPSVMEFLVVFVTESMSAIGSAIFVFVILPEIDVLRGIMLTNALCVVPALMSGVTRDCKRLKRSARLVIDLLSLIAQLSALIIWPLVENKPSLWLLPVSLFMISIGWWENFVSEKSPFKLFQLIANANNVFQNKRYFIYIFASILKALVFFAATLLIFLSKEGQVRFMFDNFYDAFTSHVIDANVTTLGEGSTMEINTDYMTVMWVFLINIISTYVCYAVGKFACKIMIQGFGYAFPINLVVPCATVILIIMCNSFNEDPCAFESVIPPYLFFNSPPLYELSNYMAQVQPWLWLLWLLSQTWITIHIWTPNCEKLASTEKLFMKPLYDAFFIDQSLAMNRRRSDKNEYIKRDSDKEMETDSITRIYACGTMWHETKEEMMEFLKSIMRLDRDQHARRIVKDLLNIDVPDYYELETHVFFDDAFVRMHEKDPDPQVNEFVKNMVEAVNDAATEVHEKNLKIRPPKKYITPYGGRLVWTLPGKTKMIAHLKDKKKIRAKKRWSQVMYMYYLLGYKLMERDYDANKTNLIAENTYILALDGDIDFQPEAVLRLVDLMKKNKSLGAACGRIHPIGSGPMVWYQMFEYAVGHWLQKATEHMIGCVLCSPGCFSLFRGKALMDDNVMKKYTTRSSEALHYVQYDQGEDRWLCTLMLQRGYRVEYSAASDAYTHCPEGFNEFYNQRRRWMPSTTANILDLLMDYKRVVKINDNISSLYIFYQGIMMIGTVVGPGTIFLMLIGAFVAAFQLDQWSSFLWNAVPILIYMFVSFLFNDKIQLFFAGVISGIYGLVMMAVLVGIMLQISNDGLLAPSSLFFFCVAGEMIFTAILHPKEFNCLKYGVIYYVTVPSMYMLLVIYSVFNMNNVSWGTREVTVVKTPEGEAPKAEESKEQTLLEKIKSFGTFNNDNSGAFEFSLGNIFKCFLCTRKDNYEETVQLKIIGDSLEKLTQKIEVLEKLQLIDVKDPESASKKLKIIHGEEAKEVTPSNQKFETIADKIVPITTLHVEEPGESYGWIDDESLQHGEVLFLSRKEQVFWDGLLEKYLHPIDDTKDKARIAKNLKDLRDKAVFAFFMLNSLFVLVVFLLTLKKDLLHINWPLDIKYNVTFADDEQEIQIAMEYLELEPIGLVFLFFFAILLVVQFIAMLLHRFGTFCQILANTHINLNCCHKNPEYITGDLVTPANAVELALKVQKLKGVDGEIDEEVEVPVDRRKTIHNIKRSANKYETPIDDLSVAFQRRWTKMINGIENNKDLALPANKKIIMNLENKRRQTVLRRKSQLPAIANRVNRRNNAAIEYDPNTFIGHENLAFQDDEADA